MRKYDYLIVGAGPFGSTCAFELTKAGKKCLVIDKRPHLAGNTYTENQSGINVHKYGAHIFHTSDKKIWDYLHQFVSFNNFINSPMANYKGDLFNLPFNMNTFYQMWGTKTPIEAFKKLETERKKYSRIKKPKNLEEQALVLVGEEIYEKLIKHYTEKQWGRKAYELPPFIIKRLPVRLTFNNNYFKDKYQGIPEGGYTQISEKMLKNIDVKLNTDFLKNREYFENCSNKIIYTGMIDEFYNYKFGILQYRSLRFEEKMLEIENFQGNAVVNYTDSQNRFTRILEHKHFEFGTQPFSLITKEFPLEWDKNKEPYYPINNNINNKTYSKYKKLAAADKKVIFGGRLGTYKYYDMHQVFASALKTIDKEIKSFK